METALSSENAEDNTHFHRRRTFLNFIVTVFQHQRRVIFLDGKFFGVRIILVKRVVGIGDHSGFHVKSAVAKKDNDSVLLIGLLRKHWTGAA